MEVWFFNLDPGLGKVDVYLEEPGTSLSAVQVRGMVVSKGLSMAWSTKASMC